MARNSGSAAAKRLAEEKANRGGRRDRGGRSGMGATNPDSYRTSPKSGLKGFGMTSGGVAAQGSKAFNRATGKMIASGSQYFDPYSGVPQGTQDLKYKSGVTNKDFMSAGRDADKRERKRYGM